MKTLGLKHLAPYLPYKLKYKDCYGNISTLNRLDVDTPEKTRANACNAHGGLVLFNIEPILRPLSDLTKPITVEDYNDGKEFVPIMELQRIEPEYPLLIEDDSIFFTDACNLNMLEISRINKLFQLLYQWHFAIDIPEGTWIDINTL